MLILLGFLLAQSSGLPTSLTQDPPPVAAVQEDESKAEFPINVNLWPLLESTTLSTGERRTSLWPLFHVTTLPKGGIHSWHVLNFLSGPNYHMLLPLYYSVDENLGILPPLYMSGSDYWASIPLLSGSWWRNDGSRTTWLTPLFHHSTDPAGNLKSVHAGPYFQGDDYWMIPPALTGSWSHADGARTTWVTPLFHATTSKEGDLESLHALTYFQGKNYWAMPPAFTWQRRYDSGETATWITPAFHSTVDRDGDFVSMHLGPYFRGKDYWAFFPLASSTWDDHGSTSTWVTPLFHLKTDAKGETETLLAGPYLGRKDWWSIWPLLLAGWEDGDAYRMTMGGVFCLKTDPQGLASASLCPIFTWDRESWCVFPLLSGHNKNVTWITPAAHFSFDQEGAIDNFHVGPYFQGKNYWMVPPALAWHWKYEDDVGALWLTPLFHTTWDAQGTAESSHLFPVYFWERDDYWAAPPILSMGWTSANGDRTIWATPFFHRTTDSDGMLRSMHLGPYLQGRNYWGIPPLLSGSWTDPDGSGTTWMTPLFHLTWNDAGESESFHVGPYFEGRNYWAVPPLLSWHVRRPNGSTTWLTPAFHLTSDENGDVESLHVLPAWLWKRDEYWSVPALLSGGWKERDGAQTTWLTPLFHDTIDKNGDLRSLHVAPLWFWERDRYWTVPPLLIGGGPHEDGAHTTWLTPMFHYTSDRVGSAESAHLLPVFFWKREDYWSVPLLLSGGKTRSDGSSTRWFTPLYHDDINADGTLRSRMALTYLEGPNYTHVAPVFWDWTRPNGVHHTLFAPPLFVRTEEPDGNVTTSLPWPLITARSGPTLDRSLGMELRPFLYQDAGDQYEFNFLWRMFSVLSDEEATRVMVGPLWYSTRPHKPDAMSKFQILGGLFARDCNYETDRYRYRLLWVIPLGSSPMP